ncbi:MAG TPA: phasin family protein [Rhizomicrobium sp.]|nr:phasin family protein [Rhizomicrobium sp.]
MARAKRRNQYSDDGSEIENEVETGEEMDGAEEMQHAAHEAAEVGQRTLHRIQHNSFEAFDVFGGPMARLMEQNWSIFQKMMHAMREESLHFVNRRLEQTTQAIESSKDCDGISDLLAVQQEWMVNLARDYAEQTKRFAELVRDLAEDGTANLSHAASEVSERGRNVVEEESRHAAA